MMNRCAATLLLAASTACGMSMGEVDGANFLASDVAYSRWTEGGSDRNVVVVVSDDDDVCRGDGIRAGRSALLIYRRDNGAASMVLEQYDDTCALTNRAVQAGGWVSFDPADPESLGVDFMFQVPDGKVQGRVQARPCPNIDPRTVTDCRP